MHFQCAYVHKYIRSFNNKKRLSVLNNLSGVQSLSLILGHFRQTLTRNSILSFSLFLVVSILSDFYSQVVHPSQLIVSRRSFSWRDSRTLLVEGVQFVNILFFLQIIYLQISIQCYIFVLCYICRQLTYVQICSRYTLSFSDLWDIYNVTIYIFTRV